MVRRSRFAVFGALLGVVGCGGKPASAPRVFVGEVTGTDARIAMVVSGDGSPIGPDASVGRVFMSGGPDALEAFTYSGTLYDDEGGMTNVRPHLALDPQIQILVAWDGADLSGNIHNSRNPVEPDFQFSATDTSDEDVAGVYEGNVDCGHAVVILSPGSTEAAPNGGGACSGAAGTRLLNIDAPLNRDADGAIHVISESDQSDVVVRRAALVEPP